MKKSKLQEFGKELIEEFRDEVLETFEMTKKGNLKSNSSLYIKSILDKIGNEEIVFRVVTSVVDDALHKLLFFLETSDEWAIIEKERAEENELETLAEISDGLSGEIYTEDGWITKYSKYEQMDDWL